MGSKIGKATFWAVLETGGAQAAAFLFFVVFARILTPNEFGVYSLAMAIVGAVNIVLFQGFGDALIQAERLDEDYASTAFWTNMLLALAMVAILQVVALCGPSLFAEPLVRPVIAWLSLLCIPRALVSVHSALFRRRLDIRVLAIRTILGSVVGGVVGMALVFSGWGIWGLVVSQFVQSFLIVFIMWRSSEWRPRMLFSRTAFQKLLHFSRHFMAASVITSCIDDFGSVLIGLGLDIAAVGYFSLALKVIRSLIVLTMTPVQVVMMPALSRIARDRKGFGSAYADMVLMTSTVWLPVVAGLGIMAPELLPAVFGAHWAGAVPVVQAMCLASLTMPLWNLSGQALSAFGRPDAFARIAFCQLGLYCVMFPLASHFSIVAVGWAWAALSFMMVPIALAMLHRVAGLDVGALLAKDARIALCGGALVVAVVLVRAVLPPGPWSMAAEVAAGAGVYAVALNVFLLPGHLTRMVKLARGSIPKSARNGKDAQDERKIAA